jgi:hypothetical protein
LVRHFNACHEIIGFHFCFSTNYSNCKPFRFSMSKSYAACVDK